MLGPPGELPDSPYLYRPLSVLQGLVCDVAIRYQTEMTVQRVPIFEIFYRQALMDIDRRLLQLWQPKSWIGKIYGNIKSFYVYGGEDS